MSEATAKATRRQMRRAIGSDGLEAVNSLALVVYKEVAPAVASLDAALHQHSRELDSHDRQLSAFHERMLTLETDAAAFRALTFRQRLTWAMQGLF